jgi:crotonobetainyl-CoA:carnitine CoA-transferase CaiB-like acyl-CoA transferase
MNALNESTTDGEGPLAGVKVVELCHLIAGPYAGMLLADEGADVIKVEPPHGELTRARAPFRSTDEGTMSGYFASLNRRKRSMALDLKTPEGAAVLERLLEEADVFITNMRPQALERLKFHPAAVLERHPQVVSVSMTGFGLYDSGPDANRAGLAMVAEALSGTTGLTRDHDGNPVWCGFALGDIMTGATAHASVLLGLLNRQRTGKGKLVDLALTESTLPLVTVALARIQAADAAETKAKGGNDFHGVPYGTFAAADGYFNIGVNRDDFWFRLCEAMGRPDLAHDERYETYDARASRQREVERLLEDWSIHIPRDEVVEAISNADVPVAPVLSMAEVLKSEHFAARGSFVDVDDAIGGTYTLPDDATGFSISKPARVPHNGEHRDEVLMELGYSPEEISVMADAGVLGQQLTSQRPVGQFS